MSFYRLCVFCGSRSGARPEYTAAAQRLGQQLTSRRIGLVYGGASVGLMGVLAGSVMEAGGTVDGVIPDSLVDRELAHRGITRVHQVRSMHERKATMARLSDGFIAMPGGAGTLDELFEIVTWAQLGLHAKPIGLLDVGGYFQPLVTFLRHAVAEGFLHAGDMGAEPDGSGRLVVVDRDVARLLDRMAERHGALPPGDPRLGIDQA